MRPAGRRSWQEAWPSTHSLRATGESVAADTFYALSMFPYPRGETLHMGHCCGQPMVDPIDLDRPGPAVACGRAKVLQPMALGTPSGLAGGRE